MLESPREDRWGDLMRAGLGGDEASYRVLLDDLARVLRGQIRSQVERAGQGNADVEDVVQETLLAIHLKRHTWDPSLPFAPWFYAVARYKMVDALRRQGRRRQVPLDGAAELAEDPSDDPTSARDVERMLSTLGGRQQKLVRALSLEGRSAADVGRELGLSEGAVRVALHRALRDLAQRFRGSGS